MLLNEFKINEHITLRLEDGLTNIYVGEHHFNHCKYLLLNIPIEDLYLYDDIESVDDAVMIYDRKMEGLQEEGIEELPPEEEFWGHCSNLQAWRECEYNTRVLHSNLSFPLLRRLTELGDPLAKSIFKNEIATRYVDGTYNVRKFLELEGFLSQFNEEELSLLRKQIIEKLYKAADEDKYTVVLDLLRGDEEDYLYSIVKEYRKKTKEPSIHGVLKHIFTTYDYESVEYIIKPEYLTLMIEHPYINLLEIAIKIANESYYYLMSETLKFSETKAPKAIKKKIKEIIEKKSLDHYSFWIYLIKDSPVEKFEEILKKMGSKLFNEVFIKFLQTSRIREDFDDIFYSMPLKAILLNKKIKLLEYIFKSCDNRYELIQQIYLKEPEVTNEILKRTLKIREFQDIYDYLKKSKSQNSKIIE